MSEESLDNNHGFQEETEYAGFWIRLGAALIDMLVLIPIIGISMYNQFDLKSIVLLYVITLISSLYKPLMEWRYGATLGKMACKIKVVNEDLKPISIDQSFGRYIPWGISAVIQLMAATFIFSDPSFKSATTFIEIGLIAQESPLNNISNIYNLVFLVIVGSLVIDKKSRGFHDKIAKTTVIKIKKD
jgi:uncharacterized RDD family membrane protein YckC